ncbi:MAG: hypothetical protein RR212_00235 [Bacteroidales bacterium]
MKYTLRTTSGYVSGDLIEMILHHKQTIKDIIVATDDGGCFEHISIYIETESKALTEYFLRKLGVKTVKGYEHVYEVRS